MSLPSGFDNWKTIIHNLDHLHRGFTELRQSIHLTRTQTSQVQLPQMQTPTAIHTPDTSVPMDINQSRPRPKMHTCYNGGEPGHLSCTCMKPQKQRIQLATSAKID